MPIAPDWLYGSDLPFAVLCAAFALDALAGGLPGVSVLLNLPAAAGGWIAGWADRPLNPPTRSARSPRTRRALIFLILLPAAAFAGLQAASLCRSVADGWILETLFVAMCVGLQRPLLTAGTVRRAVSRAAMERARAALGTAVRYDTATVDEHALARGSVELFAVRLCDGLVGPVFWYLAAGLPGLFVYRAIGGAADLLACRTERHAAFGAAAAALDRLANLLPAPATGALIAFASLFSPTARPLAALRGMIAGAGVGRLPREGWTMGAVAGSLGLCLAGPRRRDGKLSPAAWIGEGRARATPGDILRAMWLYAISGFIGLVPLVLLALVAG
ncbi:MAG: cobalamin biosynthesis protein [Rhodospirillaceae bacterium]